MDNEKKKREKFLFLPEAHNDHFVITFDESAGGPACGGGTNF